MRLEYFKYRMKHDFNFWDITKDVTLFSKPVEITDYRTNKTTKYKTIDDVFDVEVDGKKIKDYIEEMKDFPPIVLDDSNIQK